MGPQFIAVLGDVGAEGLVRIPLAKLGRWFKGALKFAITKADLAAVVANFRKRAADVVIDYDHGTEYSAGSGQPVPASGWLKEIEAEPDGQGILWGLAEFTERAREMLRTKEYKYISPVINWGTRDKATGEQQGATITSVALTNVPVLEQMPAIALSEAGWVVENATEQKEKPMKVVLTDQAAAKARVVMDDGSQHDVSVEGLQPGPKVVRLSDIKRAADGRFDFAALDTSGGTLIAGEIFAAQQAQGELDTAVKAGLILPAQRAYYEKLALSDLAGFRDLVKTMKPQVPLGEAGLSGTGDPADAKAVDSQIIRLADEKCKADKGLQFDQAVDLVLSEHPDLKTRTLRR